MNGTLGIFSVQNGPTYSASDFYGKTITHPGTFSCIYASAHSHL